MIRRSQIALLIAAAALLATAAPMADGGVSFDDAELAKLAAGETVRQELGKSRKGGFYGGTGWAVIDAPADEIWKVLIDWQKYEAIFPYTEEMTELSRWNTSRVLPPSQGSFLSISSLP